VWEGCREEGCLEGDCVEEGGVVGFGEAAVVDWAAHVDLQDASDDW
jgi:hypothetical protein